jgi:predicted Zn-dependent protease with MMP-like domain
VTRSATRGSGSASRPGPRRRDRRGRGLRAPLYPSTAPAARTRAERFDAVVLEALEPIEERWSAELADLDVAVDDVPDVGDVSAGRADAELDDGVVGDGEVPLARLVPAGVDRRGRPTRARIVVYRRPLEARALDGEDLADLLHDVLVEQVAGYLGVEPDTIADDED